MIADLIKQRDEFQATAQAQAQAGEAAWQRTKAQLESQWKVFEAQVKTYFDYLTGFVTHFEILADAPY